MPSTVIRWLSYRPEARELEVLFTTGRRYLFHEVPPEAAEALRAARIKGRHFNARIRGRYRFTELGDSHFSDPQLEGTTGGAEK
jgi:KTSC domain-containing protein